MSRVRTNRRHTRRRGKSGELQLDLTECQCEDAIVTTKAKRAYQKKAAEYVADLILDSLEQFPEKERQARLKKIHATLSVAADKRSKRPKRSSKRPSLRLSRRPAALR